MLKRSILVLLTLTLLFTSVWFMGLNSFFYPPITKQDDAFHTQTSSDPIAEQPLNLLSNSTQPFEYIAQSNASLTLNKTKNGTIPNQSEQKNKPQAALDLALEEIDLIQGEGGFELWQLKASWANIRKTDGLLIVDLPKLEYFLHDDDETNLFVTATTGEIDSDNQLLLFIDNVIATYEDTTIKGPMLLYNGTKNTMEFQNNSTVHSLDFSGSAQTIIWNMETRTIEGQGQVHVHFNEAPIKAP